MNWPRLACFVTDFWLPSGAICVDLGFSIENETAFGMPALCVRGYDLSARALAQELVARQLCDGGADLIQLRAKQSPVEEILRMAWQFCQSRALLALGWSSMIIQPSRGRPGRSFATSARRISSEPTGLGLELGRGASVGGRGGGVRSPKSEVRSPKFTVQGPKSGRSVSD